MLPQKHRLRQRVDITRVIRSGQRLNSPLLSLVYHKSGEKEKLDWRLAVIAGKKSVSLLATARNRAKRQLLNAFYQTSNDYNLDGLDFVIVAKKQVLEASFEQLQNDLRKLIVYCQTELVQLKQR